VLLGTKFKGTVDITNSFAVPFEEDLRNPSIWYLDHNFLENMYAMFKKVRCSILADTLLIVLAFVYIMWSLTIY
jgi:JAB1/Mov34/MPN/PAD-1 ubiquitin protease